MKQIILNFIEQEEGASALEYALVIAGVVGFIGIALQYLFTQVGTEITDVGGKIGKVSDNLIDHKKLTKDPF